jgi:ribosomal protein S18 acetylase RimI-like enzyme
MQRRTYSGPSDYQAMKAFLARLPTEPSVVDFDEVMAICSVQAFTRLWCADSGALVAFAYVDESNNLWFEISPPFDDDPALQAEIVAWGVDCVRQRNAQSGENATLDAVCEMEAQGHIEILRAHAFQETGLLTLKYARSLEESVPDFNLPADFSLRPTNGAAEVESLIALHRAAFGDDAMTVEYRLAMMRAPQYVPVLDLLIIAPDGELAAFCVCSIDDDENRQTGVQTGWPDPLGVHPHYQGRGLGKAVLFAALKALEQRGMQQARLGTSSDNLPMQRLAEALGFRLISKKVWFSRSVEE